MHPVRLSIGMSGFCALLVSVWLFDSDPRRGTFPALLGSGEVGRNCTQLWETSPRHFAVPSSFLARSPPPYYLPGRGRPRRAPPRLRGCARLRHRREGCSLGELEPGISRVSRALPPGLNPNYSPPFPGTPSAEPAARCSAQPLPGTAGGAHTAPGTDPPPRGRRGGSVPTGRCLSGLPRPGYPRASSLVPSPPGG